MKRHILIWLMAGLLGPVLGGDVSAQTAEPDSPVGEVHRVPWIKNSSWTKIVTRANEADQPILIDFTAKWCGPCRLLDVMVFTEEEVIAGLSKVVTFQVDIDKPEYAAIKEAFAVEVVPTLVWCDSRGNEVDRFTSYRSSDEFLEILGGWRGNRTIDRMLAEQKSTSPENPMVLLELARRHAERGQDQEAEIQYLRLMNLRHKADTRTVARGMLGLAELEEKTGNTARSDKLVTQAVALYSVDEPTPEMLAYRTEGLMEIALFQEDRGDTLAVLETYRTIVQLDDREVLGLEGFARTAVAADVELEEATRCALRAMVFSDKDARIIGTLAETYYMRGLYSKAIRWINLSIERDPADEHYRDRLAVFEVAQAEGTGRYTGSSRRSSAR